MSAAIYRQMAEYGRVLESYSRPLLALIDSKPTANGNVRVLNDTANYYRYFDATPADGVQNQLHAPRYPQLVTFPGKRFSSASASDETCSHLRFTTSSKGKATEVLVHLIANYRKADLSPQRGKESG